MLQVLPCAHGSAYIDPTGDMKMSVARKILLIALSFAIPIAVLVYLTVINIDNNITFAQWELKGDEYQRPLEDVLREVQSVEIVYNTGTVAGEETAKVDAAFRRLSEESRRLGEDLQFNAEGLAKRHREHQRAETAQQEWQELSAEVAKSPRRESGADLNPKFEHLIADVRVMITHMGDTSNLILDPDLDSYYLMDVTLLALPQTQDRLGKAILFGYQALKSPGLTEEERIRLAVHAAMLQEADVDRVSGSSRTAVNEDAGFYGVSASLQSRIPAALALYEQANRPFLEAMKSLSEGNTGVSAGEFLRKGLLAREAAFSYWKTAVDEEDVLLRIQIAHFEQRRTQSLMLASLALAVAGILALFLTRSITRPLRGVVASLSPGATLLSVCVERISVASQANFANQVEASLICQELDANCDAMRRAVAELEAQVRGAARS